MESGVIIGLIILFVEWEILSVLKPSNYVGGPGAFKGYRKRIPDLNFLQNKTDLLCLCITDVDMEGLL